MELLKLVSPDTVSNLHTTYKSLFNNSTATIHTIEQQSTPDAVIENDVVSTIVTTTRHATDQVLNDLYLLESYIHLMIPKMEDGNNFGVTIQLTAIKAITEGKEKMLTSIEDLSKYNATRADAIEKAKCYATSSTVASQSVTTTIAEGNANDQQEMKQSTDKKEVNEEKTTTTKVNTAAQPEYIYRLKAITAVDILFYRKAQSLYQFTLMTYASVVDFIQKNKEKISEPKGEAGSRSAYHSMY
jgi:hypothetical protein